ncbi:hypothetical protein SDC9_88872 [bioreactor metagenome]|uniref:Uncharacterized protein n=1 Tax=bioreactor metagenome TaxID=1076179 RepID=A0A644ZMP2_9ZZZZ
MQVSVLCQCIIGSGYFAQSRSRFGIHIGVEIREPQHVQGIPARCTDAAGVFLECLNGPMIIARLIVCFSQNALHLFTVTAGWIAAQVIQCYLLCRCILFLQQINFGSIIRSKFFVLQVVAKRKESFERFVISLLCIPYIRYIIGAVGLILAACFFERCKPDGCLFTVSCFHVSNCHAVQHVGPFRIGQLLQI